MKNFLRAMTLAGAACFALAAAAQTATTPAAPAPTQTPAAAQGPPPVKTDQLLATLQAKMMDWAQLNHFKAQDDALAAPAAGEQRVVFFGDSITEGWRGDSFFPRKSYINRGISGQTTEQMVVRFHQDVVNLHPRGVVILAGTNDIAENTGPMTEDMTLDNFRAMAEMARANGIRLVVGAIPPAADFSWHPGLEPARKIQALNQRLEAWCQSEGIVWVDYYAALADASGAMKPGLSRDGVHPTAAGYAVMSPLAQAGIERALAKK